MPSGVLVEIYGGRLIHLKGFDEGFEGCFRSLLLIPSSHAAFPTESEFKVSSTTCGFVYIDFNECTILELNGVCGGGGGGGRLAFTKNFPVRGIFIKQISFVDIFFIIMLSEILMKGLVLESLLVFSTSLWGFVI